MKRTGEAVRQADDELVAYLAEVAEQVADKEVRRHGRSVAVAAGREALFLDQFRGAVKDALQGAFGKLVQPKAKRPRHVPRTVNALFSDLHYGANLDRREVGVTYGPLEEARRTAAVCRQIAEYKPQYRDESTLLLHFLGDMIQNQLHDQRDGLPIAEQVASAMRYLVQAVRYLAHHYPLGVTVKVATGNHGRVTSRHRERATIQKFDSLETMVYVAVQEIATFLPNVTVQIGYEPKYDFELFGEIGMATHGDTVLNPGNPGRSVDVAGMAKQIYSINNARVHKGHKPYRVFMVGHVHVGTMVHLPGGVTLITNGALIPSDAYANSIGIFDTACGQWMFESVEGHMVGDARFMTVSEADDQDASLDRIISAYKGLR